MTSATPSGSPSEEAFARFLDQLERHPALRFEDWLSREPESRRPELRSLHEAYRRLQPNLPEGALVPAGSRAFFRREERERPQPAPAIAQRRVRRVQRTRKKVISGAQEPDRQAHSEENERKKRRAIN